MKIISQMDEISSININTDSTFAILLEAQNRGHEIYYYHPKDLALEENKVSAYVHKIKLQNKSGDHFQILTSQFLDLSKADIILFRQDPPFDIHYISSTYILEKIKDQVLIINNPTEIRNCPEKIFVTDFAEFTPPTIITSNLQQVINFKEKFGDVIVKPLYGGGGEGILYLKAEDKNINVVFEMMMGLYKAPFIVQKYLPEIKKGDKRILLLDGNPIGAVSRIAKKDEIRSNFHAGGSAAKAMLTAREKEICKVVGAQLKKKGLIFVGIDMIGDYLIEINVTSPTGIHEINRMDKTRVEKLVVDFLEGKVV
jgi:glutathione synthase